MVLLFVDTVNNKNNVVYPWGFWSFDGYNQLSFNKNFVQSVSPKMHAIYLFPKVFCAFNCQKGIFQFKHCYCTELFSSGINLIITEQQCTNKFNNEIFKVKSVIRENNILLCSDQFYHQTCQIFFIFISGAKGLPTISNYWSNVTNCVSLSLVFALPCLINLCTFYLIHWFL